MLTPAHMKRRSIDCFFDSLSCKKSKSLTKRDKISVRSGSIIEAKENDFDAQNCFDFGQRRSR